MNAPTEVDFHFDVMCPFAYQTSLWIRDVRDQIGLTVNWRFFSLEEINRVEGKKHPWERDWSYGWSMMRIGALLRRDRHGPARRAGTRAAGKALHVDGNKPHDPEVARHLLDRDRRSTRRSSTRRSPTRPPTTRCAPSTSGSSTPAATACRRCSSPTGSASSGRC